MAEEKKQEQQSEPEKLKNVFCYKNFNKYDELIDIF